ncbi:LexA family protein [Tissierella praeacuta]|uniref:LexA family protein n=1 Tax=Tissierella praeacuta TaxID=43131 RepID=UPI00104C55F2|nr:S24 family peptidase [Tissierella praeacuta]TCU72915.1 repressor LexA [Tissierella praeacuta]
MTVGERIKQRRKQLGLSVDDIAKKLGKNRATIYRYESNDIENLPLDILEPLAKVLNVTPSYLMGWETSEEYSNSILIPVYGSIPAGVPLEAVEDIQGYEDIPVNWLKGDKKYIALKVIGDSMYPKYLDGDTVIILVQPDCESGQDCACYVNGFNATLKTVNKYKDKIELKPINPNYPPKTYNHPGEVTILGVVKELRRKI